MVESSVGVLALFLIVGASLLSGYGAHRLSRRFHVSDVVVLLIVGLAAGPVLGLVDPEILRPAFAFLGPLGLVIVLFEGGLELAWRDFHRLAPRAVFLSLLVWVLTALAVAAVAHLLLGFPPIVGLLLGTAVCATGILVVIPLLEQLRAPSEARVLLTVETSLGDLLSAVATTALASIVVLGMTPAEGARVLGSKFLVGAAVGVLGGVLWARALTGLKAARYGYALTLAALMVGYVAAETLGGSGFLMALAFGLVVGNADVLERFGGIRRLSTLPPSARLHQSEIIFILRSVYFVYLGLVVSRDVFMPDHLLAGVVLVLAMVAARVVGVRVGLLGHPIGRRDPTRVLLTGMMPRGLAAGLIAGIPAAMGVPGTESFLTYTFLIIIGSDVATSVGTVAYARARRRAALVAAADVPEPSRA